MSSDGAGSKGENSFQLEDRITVVFLLFSLKGMCLAGPAPKGRHSHA
jgi:hypothetical protein